MSSKLIKELKKLNIVCRNAYIAFNYQAKNGDLDGDGVENLVIVMNRFFGDRLHPYFKLIEEDPYFCDTKCSNDEWFSYFSKSPSDKDCIEKYDKIKEKLNE